MKTPTEIETKAFESALADLEKKQKDKETAIINGKQVEIDYFHAIENAKASGKNVFLLFHIEGCAGCTVIKYLVEYNSEVIKVLEDYEVILINMSKTTTQLTNKFNIYTYPSYFVIDASENVLKKNMGCFTNGGVDNNLIKWLSSKNHITPQPVSSKT